MPGRRIWVPDKVASALCSLHPDLKIKLKAGFKDMLADPECGKPLKDELEGLRSMRVGRFRIIYRTGRSVIEVVAVGPRRTVYEETHRLLKK